MNTETRKTEDINDSAIVAEAEKLGIKEMEFLGKYYHPEYPDSNDHAIELYQFPDGGRVASTNGDPVWEESDEANFRDLLGEYEIGR